MDPELKDRIRRTPNRMELLEAENKRLREACAAAMLKIESLEGYFPGDSSAACDEWELCRKALEAHSSLPRPAHCFVVASPVSVAPAWGTSCDCQRSPLFNVKQVEELLPGHAYYSCYSCGRVHERIAEPPRPDRPPDALADNALENRAEIDKPQTIEQAEALVLGLATEFQAYGAMIAKCREAWSKSLRKQYGIEDGGWDVTRDQALAVLDAEVARLREALTDLMWRFDDDDSDPHAPKEADADILQARKALEASNDHKAAAD